MDPFEVVSIHPTKPKSNSQKPSRFLRWLCAVLWIAIFIGIGLKVFDEFFKTRKGFVSHGQRQIPAQIDPDRPKRPSFEEWIGRMQKVQFDPPHGYYADALELHLKTDEPNAEIRFTLDGSIPLSAEVEGGPNGMIFDRPIRIDQTTTITAISTALGKSPSIPVTQSYLFVRDILKQSPDSAKASGWTLHPENGKRMDYGMDSRIVEQFSLEEWRQSFSQIPSLSLVLPLDDLMHTDYGIYVNPAGRGKAWECYTSVEFIEKDKGFQSGAGLRIRGGFTRNRYFPKHSFRLFFRRQYGAGKLEYPLFGSKGARRFDKIDLRTAQNYSWSRESNRYFGEHNTLVRDVFCRDTQAAMGDPHTRSRYYHLFLNGLYWGIYMTEERPEAAYGASYFKGKRSDFDTLKCSNFLDGYELEAADGTIDAWKTLWKSARKLSKNPSDALYRRIGGLDSDFSRDPSLRAWIEMDNLINYMLIAFYAGNTDGPLSAFLRNHRSNNWFALRNRNGREGFRFFVHDAEHTLGVPESAWDRTGPFHSYNQDHLQYSNPQWIHQDLAQHSAYRKRFGELAKKHLTGEGVLTTAKARARFEARASQIDLAMRAQSARWGDAARSKDPYLISDWDAQIKWVLDVVLDGREEEIISQLKEDGLFPK